MEIRDYNKTEAKSRQLEGELRQEVLKSSRIESLVKVHRSRVEQKEGVFKSLKNKLLLEKKDQSPRQRFESAKNVCKQMIEAKKAAVEEKISLRGVETKKKGSEALLGIKKKQIEILQKALTEGKRILASRKEEMVFQMELDSLISCRVGAVKNAKGSSFEEKSEAGVFSGNETLVANKSRPEESVQEKVLEVKSDIIKEELHELSYRDASAELVSEHSFNLNEQGQRQQEQGARNSSFSSREFDSSPTQDFVGQESLEDFYKRSAEELQQQIEKVSSWHDESGSGVELSYTTRSGQKVQLQVKQDTEKGFSVTIVTEKLGNNWNMRVDRQIIVKALQDAGLKVINVQVLAQGHKVNQGGV